MQKAIANMSKDELILVIKSQENAVVKKDIAITEKEIALSKNEEQISDYKTEIELLKYQLADLKRQLFGAKRERFVSNEDVNQLSLPFDLPETKEDIEEVEQKIEYTRKNKKRAEHPGRAAFPSHLPVEETIIEPKESTDGLKCIGKEITEKLEYIPSKFYINRIIRPKYAKDNSDKTQTKILIGSLPEFAIYKGIAGNSLVTQLLVQKFVDHLPYYRQRQIFKRENIEIDKSTINNWQLKISELLAPLYQKMIMYVKRQGYLQVDETTIKVLDRQKKGKTHLGYYWVYYAVLQKILIFNYQKGRGEKAPESMLEDFKGYLQTDGYVVYNKYAKKEGITHVGCMAHARRYFDKALSNDKEKAEYALLKIQELYQIEKTAKTKNLDFTQTKELRLKEALPVFNELGKFLFDNMNTTLPKSPIGKAINYMLARWESLMAYMYDGALNIDNNLVENSIRPTAIGRKNYLFAGSHSGAEKAAMFYTFFGTCKINNVNPYKWLLYVLNNIHKYSAENLEELFPANIVNAIPELEQIP
jgi:transposase